MAKSLQQFIFFDLGGVVVDVESDRLMHQIAQLIGRSFEEVHATVYHEELLLPFELGQMTPERYHEGLRHRLGLPWNYEQFVGIWNGIFTENVEVTSLIQRLATRYQLMALSNTNTLHISHIRRTVPSLSVFKDWIASCEVGCRKPDRKIYELALQRAGVSADAAVYIDDRPELVEAGRRVGLTAIRFENGRQLERDLRSAGISI